ncbi:MAG: WG repeat-containing protein, partial [Planctomycetota bacterium]|nr:WG repeat-containing protein [Planctomycetota bacterium]
RGDIVIPTTFVRAGLFDAGGLALAAVGDKDHEKLGWINKTGEFVIPPEWDDVRPFAPNGLAQVSRNGLWGGIDREGRIRVEPRWYSVSVWNDWYNQPWRNDGIHVVSYSPDQWLILDDHGQEIQNLGVPPKCRYDPAECERFDFGFYRFYNDENKTGRFLHRTAMKLPGPVRRIASKITEPLNKWSLEYDVLDNSGTTIWSSVQSEKRRRLAKLLAIAGGICLVWSFGQSSFIRKFRLRGTFSNRPCGDSEISERCVEEVATGMSEQ